MPLRAGALRGVVVTLANLSACKSAERRWRTKGMAKSPVPASRIYADARLADARASLLKLRRRLNHTADPGQTTRVSPRD
jgi:hypothetical protein